MSGFFPPEFAAAKERHELLLEDFRHGFQRLFEELDKDQLVVLRTMLHVLADHTESQLASAWEGMIAHALKARFNVCMSCGVNHDEELLSPPPQETTKDQKFPIFDVDEIDRELLKKYHLDDVYDGDSGALLYFICTGIDGSPGPCGMRYPTIEDRMVKGPEECSGCYVRIAHG